MKFYSPDKLTRECLKSGGVCHYEFNRNDVEKQHYAEVDRFFDRLKKFGSIARQKVLFTFAGYDDDKRELIYISDVTKYIKNLIQKHPYFWYFAVTFNSEIFVLAFLIDEDNHEIANIPITRKFYLKQDNEAVIDFVKMVGFNLSMFGQQINDTDGSVESMKLWGNIIMEIKK